MLNYSKSKSLFAIVGILLVAGLGFFVLRGGENDPKEVQTVGPRPVRAVTVETRGAKFSRSYSGRVKASQEVSLTFRVSGPIIELPVLKGQNVENGELLARIDPRDYETNLANTRSALENARAQLTAMKEGARSEEIAVLEASLASARSQLSQAKANFDRYGVLLKQGAVSKAEYERYQTSYQVAQAQVRSAQEQLKQGKAGARAEDIQAMESTIQGLEASVKAAEDALKDTNLYAPFAGRIADRFVEQFQNVSAGQSILHIQNLNTVDIVVNVPEADLAQGQAKELNIQGPDPQFRAMARFDALPQRTFPLELKEIATQADPESQTYPVTLIMPQPEGITILPGMIAEVDVTVMLPTDETAGNEAWPVPVEAVFLDEQGQSRIWKIDPGTGQVHAVDVTVRNYMGADVFISGKLAAGDQVISAGTGYLSEGEEVRVIEGRIGK